MFGRENKKRAKDVRVQDLLMAGIALSVSAAASNSSSTSSLAKPVVPTTEPLRDLVDDEKHKDATPINGNHIKEAVSERPLVLDPSENNRRDKGQHEEEEEEEGAAVDAVRLANPSQGSNVHIEKEEETASTEPPPPLAINHHGIRD